MGGEEILKIFFMLNVTLKPKKNLLIIIGIFLKTYFQLLFTKFMRKSLKKIIDLQPSPKLIQPWLKNIFKNLVTCNPVFMQFDTKNILDTYQIVTNNPKLIPLFHTFVNLFSIDIYIFINKFVSSAWSLPFDLFFC